MDSEHALDIHLNEIATTLARAHGSGVTCLGSFRHDFRLLPPIGEDQLASLELGWRVHLPPVFRAFVTRLGNGGAGPLHGLHVLGPATPVQGGHLELASSLGTRFLLGLAGHTRGLVLRAEGDDEPTLLPHPDVLSWYRSWLDAAISGQVRNWTGHEPPQRVEPIHVIDEPAGDDAQRWMPHSDFAEPAQRPSRPPVEGDVQGLQPIEG